VQVKKTQGLVEGLVPVRATISDRSTTDASAFTAFVEAAASGLDVNSVALYVKGARIGYASALPFLASQRGLRAGEQAGDYVRHVIDRIHSAGQSVGAIVQIYRYEEAFWGTDLVWKRARAAQSEHVLAAASHPSFLRRLRLVLHELVSTYPDLDFLFLEGEPFAPDAFLGPLREWLASKDLRFDGPTDELCFDAEIARTTKALGEHLDAAWSSEGLAFGVDYTRAAIEIAEEVYEDVDWRGARGFVYPAVGPESRYLPVATAGGRWLLVPRIVAGESAPREPVRRRAAWQHLLHLRRSGRRVCLLLELSRPVSPECLIEARELAELARENLDGLLVADSSAGSALSLVERLSTSGIILLRQSKEPGL
jgi:hypothetical protein